MSIFHHTLDRLADFLWTDRTVTMHFRADYRIARFALPLIQQLLTDDEDGETYRCSIAQWTINERPTLHVHRGVTSTLRIDGPLQNAGDTYLPLGGLIEAPHVTAHLDPIEADRLDRRVQEALDRTLHDWIGEHGLYDQPRRCREIDRHEADREARAVIARWVADLPRVDNLARLLPEGRKFGAAVVLTFQALGQMRHRYGPQIAESMLGCCNTKLFLQTIDSETRQWASQTIGECEVEIQTMTDALAEGDDEARTTLGRMRKMRPAVLESELRLPKFEGYLLFPDGLPVARIRLTADHVARRGEPRQPGFIAGDPDTTLWKQAGAVAPAPSPTPPSPPSEGPV